MINKQLCCMRFNRELL